MNEALHLLNGLLEKGFREVLLLSLMASVLASVILLLRVLLRKSLRPGWLYVLWLPLLLRLAVPWSPESSLSLYGWLPRNLSLTQQQTVQTSDAATPNLSNDVMQRLAKNGESAQPETATESAIQSAGTQPTQTDNNSAAASTEPQSGNVSVAPIWLTAAAWIWLAGTVALLGLGIRSGRRFDRRVRRDIASEMSTGPEAERIRQQLAACCAELGLRRVPQLVVTDSVSVPTVFGAWRPRLLLPPELADTLPERQLRHILLHELAHIKRRDIPVNLLAFALTCLHWFNPLLAWAFRKLREDQEIACDELALGRLSPDERKEYGLTLIALLERSVTPSRLPAASGMWSGRRERKRRISLIAGYRKNTGISLAAGMLAVLLLAGCALSGPPDQSPDSGGHPVVSNPASDSKSDNDASSGENAGNNVSPETPASAVIPSTEIEVPAEGEEGYKLAAVYNDISVYVKQADDPAEPDIPQGRFILRKKDGTASAYLWNYDSRNGNSSVLISETQVSGEAKPNIVLIVPTSNADAEYVQEAHVLDTQTLQNVPVEDPLAYAKQRLHSTVARANGQTVSNLEFDGIHITKVYDDPDESILWDQPKFKPDVRFTLVDDQLVSVLELQAGQTEIPFVASMYYGSDFSVASTLVHPSDGLSGSDEELPMLAAQALGIDAPGASADWTLRKEGDVYLIDTNDASASGEQKEAYGINGFTGTLFDPTSGAPVATLGSFAGEEIRTDLNGLRSSDGSAYRATLEARLGEIADAAGWTLSGDDWIEGFSGDGSVLCRIVFEGREMTVKVDVFTGMWSESK